MALAYQVKAGTPGCDTEDELRMWIKHELGLDPFEPTGPPLHTAHATVDRQGKAFHGVLEVRAEDGSVWLRKEWWERSCVRVLDWFVLFIGFSVLPPPDPPPPDPPPKPDCNDACMLSLRVELRELRARQDALQARNDALQKEVRALRSQVMGGRMDLTYALSTGVLMTANLTPNVGPGVWLGGELRTGPFALALEARAALPSNVQVGQYNTDYSEFTLLLAPCGRYRYVVDFFGCGVAGAGYAQEYDSNFLPDRARHNSGYVVRLGGRLGLEVPFMDNRLAARVWADVLYGLPPTTIGYLKDGKVEAAYDIPDASAFFGLGLVVKFGDHETR